MTESKTTSPEPEKVKVKTLAEEKLELANKMHAIETECGGFGNIPMVHDYWELRKSLHRLRALG